MQGGFSENNISHQKKANWETNGKGHHESSDMWLEGYEAEIEHFLMKDIIVADKVNENIE
jgi:hypothetical protein